MLKFGTGFDWMAVSNNAAGLFAQLGWYGLPGGPNPALMRIEDVSAFGGHSLELDNNSVSEDFNQANYLLPNGDEVTTWFQGARMYIPTEQAYQKPFIGISRTGVGLMTLCFKDFGQIELWRGRPHETGATLLATSPAGSYRTNTWFYVELGGLLTDDAAGWVIARINTVNVIHVVSTVTQPDGLLANSYYLGFADASTPGTTVTNCFWDDLYLTDTGGGENNNFLGNTRAQSQLPASNTAQVDFNPFPTLTPNYLAASNVAVNDTSYVYSDVAGDYDLYNVAPILNAPQVFGVVVLGAYRQDDATQRSVSNTIKSGTTEVDGTVLFTNSSYTFSIDLYEHDPDTDLTWLYPAVNLIQIGPKLRN